MYLFCYILLSISNGAQLYPSNITNKIPDSIGLLQVISKQDVIVAIVVPITVVIVIICVLFFVWFIKNQRRTYQKLDDDDDGPVALRNTKETCYINSMIQAVASSDKLIEKYKRITESKPSSKLSKLVELLENINNEKNNEENIDKNTNLLIEIIKDVQWNKKSQQDSFDVLSKIINGLEKDYNNLPRKEKIKFPPKFELLHTFTENPSFNKVQDHLALAVPLVGNYREKPGVSLSKLVDAFFVPSDIDDGTYKTQMHFFKELPQILIIHIQANEWDPVLNQFSKPTYYVQYTETFEHNFMVQMEKEGFKSEERRVEYRLLAVVHHMGGVSGGHYVTYRKHNEQWYLTNDEQVEKTSFSADLIPYIMIYEKEWDIAGHDG